MVAVIAAFHFRQVQCIVGYGSHVITDSLCPVMTLYSQTEKGRPFFRSNRSKETAGFRGRDVMGFSKVTFFIIHQLSQICLIICRNNFRKVNLFLSVSGIRILFRHIQRNRFLRAMVDAGHASLTSLFLS